MRIIGEIKHPVYKITVLQMNEKITIQIEDRLISQSFVFRDGTGVRDLSSAQQFLTPLFLLKVDKRFKDMHADYIAGIELLNAKDFEDFDII